jgi:Holliday junction resolvasome RuvABC endonuclease subunit
MIFVGIDPGFSGAWGMVDHNGGYISCGDMLHSDKHIETRMVWAEMSQARDRQDCMVIVEAVHSMPGQGVSSTFKFGTAFGGALALAERFNCPWFMVTPQVWKKSYGLNSEKEKSLEIAREMWPNAPLTRKKDNGRAEALLMANYLRKMNA